MSRKKMVGCLFQDEEKDENSEITLYGKTQNLGRHPTHSGAAPYRFNSKILGRHPNHSGAALYRSKSKPRSPPDALGGCAIQV